MKSRMLYSLSCGALLPLLLPACPGSDNETTTTTALATTAYEPKLETVPCRFPLPTNVKEGETAFCGDLIVPENRQDAAGRTVRLHFVRFASQNQKSPKEPLVFLTGGPGQRSGGFTDSPNLGGNAKWYADRDFVMVDQRGIGESDPRLECDRESIQIQNEAAHVNASDVTPFVKTSADALVRCAKRHEADGVDLTSYNNEENAADIDDLRKVLGAPKISLWGISYGGGLALEILHRYPNSIRSAAIDSPQSPTVNPITNVAVHLDSAVTAVFAACRADAKCNASYPDLGPKLDYIFSSLQSHPVTVNVQGKPTTINGVFIAGLVADALDRPKSAAELPLLTYYLYELLLAQKSESVAKFLESVLNDSQSSGSNADDDVDVGVLYAVDCALAAAFPAESGAGATPLTHPFLVNGASTFDRINEATCAGWPVRATTEAPSSIRSDVPTLFLAGAFDKRTPPGDTQTIARGFSHGYPFVYPGAVHSLSTQSACAVSMMQAFLVNPDQAPDAACIAKQKVEFAYPPEPTPTERAATTGATTLPTEPIKPL